MVVFSLHFKHRFRTTDQTEFRKQNIIQIRKGFTMHLILKKPMITDVHQEYKKGWNIEI